MSNAKSCRVIFGMLVALPITLLYYIVLGLGPV
jgi:auxin efflux carrier family protein